MKAPHFLHQHSPGPWVNNEGSIESESGVVIAYVHGAEDFPCVDAGDEERYRQLEAECEANASLVAASPALLANLEFAVWHLENPRVPPTRDAIANMKAILAMAKGGA